jgi:hypothetical protein
MTKMNGLQLWRNRIWLRCPVHRPDKMWSLCQSGERMAPFLLHWLRRCRIFRPEELEHIRLVDQLEQSRVPFLACSQGAHISQIAIAAGLNFRATRIPQVSRIPLWPVLSCFVCKLGDSIRASWRRNFVLDVPRNTHLAGKAASGLLSKRHEVQILVEPHGL